jgi:hypothetical protein
MISLETTMIHYFRRERIFRNGTLLIILFLTVSGLYLGAVGLYESSPGEMEIEITKFEEQKYRLLTERISESEAAKNFKMNPRWARVLSQVPATKQAEPSLSELVKGVKVDHELLDLKTSKAIEQLKKEKILDEGLKEKIGGTKRMEGVMETLKKDFPDEMAKAVEESSDLTPEEKILLQRLGKPPEKLSQILKTVPLSRIQMKKEILRKNIIEFVNSLKKGDEAFDAKNFFMAEDFYRNAWRYAQDIESWEACLLIGIRFLTLVEPRRISGGKRLTAQQCFEDALHFAIEKRSIQGCRKIGIALKLMGSDQLSNLAFEKADEFEKEKSPL